MNKVIPETPKNWAVPSLGNGLIDIRKDERKKTIEEVLEFLKEDPYCDCITIRSFEKEFLIPSSVNELAEKIKKISETHTRQLRTQEEAN